MTNKIWMNVLREYNKGTDTFVIPKKGSKDHKMLRERYERYKNNKRGVEDDIIDLERQVKRVKLNPLKRKKESDNDNNKKIKK